jgi:hypothetical protein
MGADPAGLEEIGDIFVRLISIVVGLGFIALLVMIVMAGFKYLTSGGDPKNIQAAHQTASWAFLGVIFLAVSWLILQLIAAFTGIDVTIFNVNVLCNVVLPNGKGVCEP